MPPDVYREMQVETEGRFGGLGIEITMRDDVLTVVSPIEGTPAFRAGIQPGDQIVKVDGESTKEMSLVDAVKKLRGPEGSSVTIAIFRQGFTEPKDFTLSRAVIQIKVSAGQNSRMILATSSSAVFTRRPKRSWKKPCATSGNSR